MSKKLKRPDYVVRAQKTFDEKHDKISVRFPKGYNNLIRENFGPVNAYINQLVTDDLQKCGLVSSDGSIIGKEEGPQEKN